jgi:Xaa-Pro aminopeptidase
MEYEIEAEIFPFIFKPAGYGSCLWQYPIASGDRARTLHIFSNNEECKAGELILMDFGAEYGGYCADLTRKVPVNGKFGQQTKDGL